MSRAPFKCSCRRSQISDRNEDSAEEEGSPKQAANPPPFKKCLEIIVVQKTPGAFDVRAKTTGIVGKDHAKRAGAESEEVCVPECAQGRARCQPAGVLRQLCAQFAPTLERFVEVTCSRDRKKCEDDEHRTEKQRLVFEHSALSKGSSAKTDQQQEDHDHADQPCRS